jgi:hypothetical protein
MVNSSGTSRLFIKTASFNIGGLSDSAESPELEATHVGSISTPNLPVTRHLSTVADSDEARLTFGAAAAATMRSSNGKRGGAFQQNPSTGSARKDLFFSFLVSGRFTKQHTTRQDSGNPYLRSFGHLTHTSISRRKEKRKKTYRIRIAPPLL